MRPHTRWTCVCTNWAYTTPITTQFAQQNAENSSRSLAPLYGVIRLSMTGYTTNINEWTKHLRIWIFFCFGEQVKRTNDAVWSISLLENLKRIAVSLRQFPFWKILSKKINTILVWFFEFIYLKWGVSQTLCVCKNQQVLYTDKAIIILGCLNISCYKILRNLLEFSA